jgi:D-alanyl-D-alanine carboxypeptidase/D-alanyl-D-alanine-endopeptidase (penicillin-binding protein 4)
VLERETGRLEGDLVVRPVGDPTLSERFYPSAEAPLDSLAQGLWDAGLRSVSGSLVVDASAWDSTTVPESWTLGNLSYSFGATGAALAIAEGAITVEVAGGSGPGEPARARWWPETPTGFFHPAFITVSPDSSLEWKAHYLPESRLLRVEGAIPAGTVDTLSLAQRDPEGVALRALLRAMGARGIGVDGGARVSHTPGEPLGSGRFVTGWARDEDDPHPSYLPGYSDGDVLATLNSPPMAEIVEAILESSQNWMTEQLVHTLGLLLGKEGSWREGFRVQTEFLTGTVGVDSLDLHFRDGSGLSAYNLVTPRALVSLLEYMRRSPHGKLYRQVLAEPSEEEGTLRNRLSGLEGRLFAKTGTIPATS